MIKVIREGDNNISKYKLTCDKCKSWLQYSRIDIQFEVGMSGGMRLIKCPVCEEMVLHSDENIMEG